MPTPTSAPAAPFALPATLRVFERGWLSANNILFVDGDETALVDSGYVTHSAQTLALVEAGLGGRPLRRLINTHLHSDHCGGNAALQARWQPRTAIPAAEAEAVRRWDAEALSFVETGQQCDPFGFDELLRDGDELMLGGIAWRVVAAPGHDPHAVMLYTPDERILISGDALWENGFGVIFPELDGESGFAEQAAVLECIAGLAPKLVIPGHGRLFTDVEGALARARGRLGHLRADPRRNASHAVKVLVKFKLLEQGSMRLDALQAWMEAAPLMQRIHARFLSEQPLGAMLDEVVRSLAGIGALALQDGLVVDRG